MRVNFLLLGLILLLVSSVTGCGQSYTEQAIDLAYEAGHAEGYDAGSHAGYEEGYGNALASIQDQITDLESQLTNALTTIESLENDRAIRQKYIAFLNVFFEGIEYQGVNLRTWKDKIEEKAEITGDTSLIMSVEKILNADNEINWTMWWGAITRSIARLSLTALYE